MKVQITYQENMLIMLFQADIFPTYYSVVYHFITHFLMCSSVNMQYNVKCIIDGKNGRIILLYRNQKDIFLVNVYKLFH